MGRIVTSSLKLFECKGELVIPVVRTLAGVIECTNLNDETSSIIENLLQMVRNRLKTTIDQFEEGKKWENDYMPASLCALLQVIILETWHSG